MLNRHYHQLGTITADLQIVTSSVLDEPNRNDLGTSTTIAYRISKHTIFGRHWTLSTCLQDQYVTNHHVAQVGAFGCIPVNDTSTVWCFMAPCPSSSPYGSLHELLAPEVIVPSSPNCQDYIERSNSRTRKYPGSALRCRMFDSGEWPFRGLLPLTKAHST